MRAGFPALAAAIALSTPSAAARALPAEDGDAIGRKDVAWCVDPGKQP